nr:hypothetical protein [Candidatus Sigynarchaeota archaeon]
MKFIKGFLVSIALYVGLSILFQGLAIVGAGGAFESLFLGLDSISRLLYAYLADPALTTVFRATVLYIAAPTDWSILMAILGSVLPIALAAVLGSLAERKSGSVKYIFLSTFLGLMVIAAVGIILQVLNWPALGVTLTTNHYEHWEWFLPGALIMTALNAFVWCAIGLFITSKGWG